MELHYYAQKKWVKAGVPQTPANYPYSTVTAAEKQFHLLCSAALQNEVDLLDPEKAASMDVDQEAIEYGTIETGVIKREYYKHNRVQPEPEPTPESPEEPESQEET